MGHEGEPRLEEEGDYACPIEKQALGKMRLHIVPMDMVYNERKCV